MINDNVYYSHLEDPPPSPTDLTPVTASVGLTRLISFVIIYALDLVYIVMFHMLITDLFLHSLAFQVRHTCRMVRIILSVFRSVHFKIIKILFVYYRFIYKKVRNMGDHKL